MSRHELPPAPTHADCPWCQRHVVVNRHTGQMNGHAAEKRGTTRCGGSNQHYTSRPPNGTTP